MRRLPLTLVLLAVLGLVAYSTLVSHAEHPCLITKANPCTKYLHPAQK